MNQNDTLRMIERELENWPRVQHSIKSGTKHPKIVLQYNGKSRFVTYSSTKIDGRAAKNMLALVKRTLREIGAERVQ